MVCQIRTVGSCRSRQVRINRQWRDAIPLAQRIDLGKHPVRLIALGLDGPRDENENKRKNESSYHHDAHELQV